MKLPHAEAAIVEIRKIRDYCLSAEHPRGRHKARVFASALGLTANDAEALADALLQAARENEAYPGVVDPYGERYLVDFVLERNQRKATIRSCWNVERGQQRPRFVTCFLL